MHKKNNEGILSVLWRQSHPNLIPGHAITINQCEESDITDFYICSFWPDNLVQSKSLETLDGDIGVDYLKQC